jgi:hypothetical protein
LGSALATVDEEAPADGELAAGVEVPQATPVKVAATTRQIEAIVRGSIIGKSSE